MIFIGAVIVRLVFHFVTGFVADDAFITFRYAQNIAAGDGFVYNTGEHVLGTTSPLFTLILSLFAVLGIGAVHGALLVSLAASGFTAALIYRFAERLRFGSLWVVPVFLYVLWPRSLPAEASGMEAALFTVLVVAVFYYRFTRRDYYALAAATLSVVTRPEGLLLLGLLLIDVIYRRRDEWLRFLAIPAAIIVPWTAWATWYFGSPVPHSIPAKLALYSHVGAGTPLDRLVRILSLDQPYGWVLVVAVIIGASWLYRKQAFGRLELIWLVGMIAFYTASRTIVFFWYLAPLYPLLLLFAGAALLPPFERFDALAERQSGLVPVLALAILLVLGGYDVTVMRDWRDQQERMDECHRAIGWYLRTHADPGDEVAVEDIGYIGYISRLEILDRDGLVSPETVPYNRAQQYGQLIYDYQPDWVVASTGSPISGFMTDSLFLEQYVHRQSYRFSFDVSYRVFQRAVSTTH